MPSDFFRTRTLLAIAVSAGVVIGATGMFLYKIQAEKRRQRRINRLEMTIIEMREELRLVRQQTRNVKKNSETEMHSATSEADDEDVFYDFSDEELDVDYVVDLKDLLSKATELLKQGPEEKVKGYNLLLRLSEENPDNADVYWHLAKACHMLGVHVFADDLEKKKIHIEQGIKYARFSVQLDKYNAESHKWLAILVGVRAEYSPLRDKITDGINFKKHLDIALSLNPQDPVSQYLLGRFKFEVAILSWFERKFVTTVFKDFPIATFLEALEDLLKAEELNPEPWKLNRLYVAKCYYHMCNLEMFYHWLQKAAEAPIKSEDDETAEEEIQDLLSKQNK